MNDLRELAERIVRDKDIRGYITREEEVDLTEAILREHHEELLTRLNNTSFIAPGYEGDPEFLETFRVVWLVDVRHVLGEGVSDD